jgi:tRNA-splicing ligase RtcB
MDHSSEVYRRLGDYRWEVPVSFQAGMRVGGIIYASRQMLTAMMEERVYEQVANVACLPGIVGHSLAMPDIHRGYGFPIGGVAATLADGGVISPGGVGYDINCGVRLLKTNLMAADIRPRLGKIVAGLFNEIPSGLGTKGKVRLGESELDGVMTRGAGWAVKHGYGNPDDLEMTEEHGCLNGADPDKVSVRARRRGLPQSGTLGSGNHFLEIQAVGEIYDQKAAAAMGIGAVGQVLILIHTGSRGFGHQVCDDYLKIMSQTVRRYGIEVPDRELACAPFGSPEAADYLAAMACAANYAWANRQIISHWVRESVSRSIGMSPDALGFRQVYDVAHNIARIERHSVDGKTVRVCVHRKGATRSLPPNHPDLPVDYAVIGQPVLIPGDMGRCSYVAVGTEVAMRETFGSTCHGAGRVMSRGEARRHVRGADVIKDLSERGITVMAGDLQGLAEEAPEAYKDVNDVVEVAHSAGLCCKVLKAVPLGVIKG